METELWRSYLGTARRKRRQQTNWTYGHRATSRLYRSEIQAQPERVARAVANGAAALRLPPFALSLSKGLVAGHEGFDKLSPNGGYLLKEVPLDTASSIDPFDSSVDAR